MITTRELAELAGVNQSTISRSLSNHPGVSEKTRKRIQDLARDHGYFSYSERSQSLKNRNAITVLLSDSFFKVYNDHFIETLIYTMLEEIDAAGYFPIVTYDQFEKLGTKKIQEVIAAGNIAGILIINREYNGELDEFLKKIPMPHIYMHYFNRNSSEEINVVDINHFVGGYIATRHLLELGHTNILTVTSEGREFEERTSGFHKAMSEAGLKIGSSDIISLEHNYDIPYEFAMENRDFLTQYSAVFVQNDLAAIGFINALQDQGLMLPEDLSIIGYDDIDAGRFCRPALTTVQQSVKELAKTGIKRITDIIQTEEPGLLQTYIQPKLLVRGSTAKNKKQGPF